MALKVSITSTKFTTIGKNVVCTIATTIKNDNPLPSEPAYPFLIKVFTGEAKYNEEDKYDYKKGRAIALAKAERASYKYWKKFLEGLMDKYTRGIALCTPLYGKCSEVIAHNTLFIDDLVSNK